MLTKTRTVFCLFVAAFLLVFPVMAQEEVVEQPVDDPSWQAMEKIEQANAELDKMAKDLAASLSHPGFRGHLKSEIAKSKNRENILEFEKFLGKAKGRKEMPPGLAKMKDDVGKANGRIKALKIWDLEGFDLYFPVKEHLRKWKGKDDLYVAYSPYTDESAVSEIYAYSVKTGEKFSLDPKNPPTEPVLIIAPEEHENHDIMEMPELEEPLPPDERAIDGDFSPKKIETEFEGNSRLKFKFIKIYDDHEPWTRGDPEIYMFYADARYNNQHGGTVWLNWVNKENQWYSLYSYVNSYFDAACTNEGVVVVMERDGGSYVYVVRTILESGTIVSFKKKTGDDYVGGFRIYKSNFSYDIDYGQSRRNAFKVKFRKSH